VAGRWPQFFEARELKHQPTLRQVRKPQRHVEAVDRPACAGPDVEVVVKLALETDRFQHRVSPDEARPFARRLGVAA